MKEKGLNYLTYKGFRGTIEVSENDNCLYGKVQGLSKMLLSYEGNTLDELEAGFKDAVDEYIDDCKNNNVECCLPSVWK